MKIKRDSDDDDEDDIDCDDPDDEDQFDECDEDDVGEDDDEKWICQCKSNAQHHLVCVRVINPKWSLKCGYGPYPDLTGIDCVQGLNKWEDPGFLLLPVAYHCQRYKFSL